MAGHTVVGLEELGLDGKVGHFGGLDGLELSWEIEGGRWSENGIGRAHCGGYL